MKAVLIGIGLIIACIAEMVFVQDATAFIFFAPVGAYFVAMGFKYEDQVMNEEFWEDRNGDS